MSCGAQSRSLNCFWTPTTTASRCSGVAHCIGGAWLVTRMTPWFMLGLALPEAGETSREGLVRFVQFEFKLSHHTSTPRCFHLHTGVQAFCPQVTNGAEEPGQLCPVCVWHFEDR